MVKPVSLSDPAFQALRDEKRENESDSDVVLRLVDEAQDARRDPWHFVRTRTMRERVLPAEEHEDAIEAMRSTDQQRTKDRWEARHDRP